MTDISYLAIGCKVAAVTVEKLLPFTDIPIIVKYGKTIPSCFWIHLRYVLVLKMPARREVLLKQISCSLFTRSEKPGEILMQSSPD